MGNFGYGLRNERRKINSTQPLSRYFASLRRTPTENGWQSLNGNSKNEINFILTIKTEAFDSIYHAIIIEGLTNQDVDRPT